MNRNFYSALSNLLKSGASADLYTILSGEHSGRDLTGQKAFLDDGGLVPCDPTLDGFWRAMAGELSSGPFPRAAVIGGVQFLAERLCSRQNLVICGGGHIAVSLAAIGAMLDFDVTVIDDRPEFANRERFPDAHEVICQPFTQALQTLVYSDSSYFVIVTRGHENDRFCLEQILHQRFAYCGMIGSRKKVAVVMAELERQGYEKSLLERVHAPVGLRIGAQTPAEIGVCIAAEIIQVRSGAADGSFPHEALARLANGDRMMLATIVEKRGSAPRGIGAKLLVDTEGTLYGTIGGGAAEAKVLSLAGEVSRAGTPRIVECNMTNDDARQAGMVCGGVVTVLLEPII